MAEQFVNAPAPSREEFNALNSKLASLIKISTVSLSSDANGNAKLPNITTANHVVLNAAGAGFMAIPFNGGDGSWYVRFTTPSNYAALSSITRDITYAYINK